MEKIPVAPEGYHFTSRFRYPKKLAYIAESLPILTALSFYQVGYWGLIDGGRFRGVAGFQGITGVATQAFVIVTVLSVHFFHGLIQRGVSRLLGYKIDFFTLFVFLLEPTFAASSGQFQSRRDALLIALTPLSLFLFLLVPVLLVPHGMVSYMLSIFLLVNLMGTGWNFYFVCWLLRKSKGTVFYIESSRTLLLFEPV